MSVPIRILLIDDEPLARDLVRHYLKQYPAMEVVAECENGFEGLKAIQELKPDLVFLDIEMPRLTGLEMLELVEEPPVVIFTTAYQEYAIRAFELNALDYLLKPFTPERFKKALDKVEERLRHRADEQQRLKAFIEEPPLRNATLDRVVVKTVNAIKVIPVEQILYLETQDDYVMIYTEEGKFLKQQTMKYFEGVLNPLDFIRIHRSYIVHIPQIVKIEPYDKTSYQMVLKNGVRLPISRSGYTALKKKLDF